MSATLGTKKKNKLVLGERYAEAPAVGPYATAIQCDDGLWKVELNDAGRELVEEHLKKYPAPCKVVFYKYPDLYTAARLRDPKTGNPDHEFQEAARMGVLRAALDFDPDKSKFNTYANWYVRSHLGKLVRHLTHPSAFRTRLASSYDTEDGPDSWDLISEKSKARPGTIDSKRSEAAETLAPWLRQLNPRELRIITLRFGLDDLGQRTLQEVGDELGLTKERIRQVEAVAMLKLWKASREGGS